VSNGVVVTAKGEHRRSAAPPIWEPDDDTDRTDWSLRTLRAMRAGRRPRPTASTHRRVRHPRGSRHPGVGLAGAVLLGLLAALFGWFGAEPLWLSLGHGTSGVATVQTCTVHGLPLRCADFTAEGDAFVAGKVTLLVPGSPAPGTRVPARMVSATGSAAYQGGTALRWVSSLIGVLLCGAGIAWLTGARQLPERRDRLAALGLSLGVPVALAAGMLAAAW
jgi:hypothetical protein